MDAPLKGPRAYANWLRSNRALRARAAEVSARPLKLTIDPTNACQLRCALCPTGLGLHDRHTGITQAPLIEHLLDEVGDYLFFIDFYNWGEPLLNPHVEEFIELAAARKIVCNMSTNLSLPLSDERIGRLVTCGLHELTVSLDGASQETYEIYRRRGQFDLVCENMRRLAAEKRRLGRRKPIITWQFLVFRFNEHEIERARAMAEEIGVDRIAFRTPLVEVERYPLPEPDRDAAKWTPSNSLFQVASAAPSSARPNAPCGWHYMAAAVNWEGGVAPCCTLYAKAEDFGTLGAAGEHPYMGVWNNSAYRAVRERFAGRRSDPTGLVCEHCPTPSIQNLQRHLNRQIVLFTVAGLMGAVRRLFRL